MGSWFVFVRACTKVTPATCLSCLCLLTAGGAIVAVDVAMLLYKGSAKEKNHENLRVCNISATFLKTFFFFFSLVFKKKSFVCTENASITLPQL